MGDSPNGPTAPVARDRTVHDTRRFATVSASTAQDESRSSRQRTGEVATCRVKRPAELRGATATTVDGDEESVHR